MFAKAAFVALPLFLGCVGVAFAEEGPYPVRLNPSLGLESVDPAAIDTRLHRPFWPESPEEGALKLYIFNDPMDPLEPDWHDRVAASALATNCVELKALTEAGYRAFVGLDDKRQRGLLEQCESIEMLRRARPARVSYVRDFVMNANAVDLLPAMVNNARLSRRLCDEYIANKESVPWSAFDKIVNVEVRSDHEMHVLTEHPDERFEEGNYVWIGGGLANIQILAWGDFNSDGIEDLLIDSGSRSVTWRKHEDDFVGSTAILDDVYILTRDTPNAVLHVVDSERYLTREKLDQQPCVYP